MGNCDNNDLRDALPDYVGGRLSDIERARVARHVAECVDCADELNVVRMVRAARAPVAIDVARIVAQLPRPLVSAAVPAPVVEHAASVSPISSAPSMQGRRAASRRTSGVWKMAAAIGVIIAGSWSVYLVQRGSIATVAVSQDSLPLSDSGTGIAVPPVAAASDGAPDSAGADATVTTRDAGAAVSFGDVGNYTDEELKRVLDRLERWDGATSAEVVTTSPVLPVPVGGGLE
ncbi:MAG: zf-HC2 domain-containing protein [Gemmatimonadaceae bacterium]|nr:zf-HC2 domain-containing protein [Gemmatimonadaceae bacterium]